MFLILESISVLAATLFLCMECPDKGMSAARSAIFFWLRASSVLMASMTLQTPPLQTLSETNYQHYRKTSKVPPQLNVVSLIASCGWRNAGVDDRPPGWPLPWGKHGGNVREYLSPIRGVWDRLPSHPCVSDIHQEPMDGECIIIPGLGGWAASFG